MRWLVDENVPMPSVVRLREAGLDLLAVTEVAPSISDEEVVAWAVQEGRGIITMDRDYGRLIFFQQAVPPTAVLYVRSAEFTPTTVADRVLAFLAIEPEPEGHYVTLTDQQIRMRPLP